MATKFSEMTGAPPEEVYDDPPPPDPDPFEIIGPDPTPEEIEAAREEYDMSRPDPENKKFEEEAEAIRVQMEMEQAAWLKANTERFNADVAKIEAEREQKELDDAAQRAAELREEAWQSESRTVEGAVDDAKEAVKAAIKAVSPDATDAQAEEGAQMVADDVAATLEAVTELAEPAPAVLPIRNVKTNRHGGIDAEIEHPTEGWMPYTVPDEPKPGAEQYLADTIKKMHNTKEQKTK